MEEYLVGRRTDITLQASSLSGYVAPLAGGWHRAQMNYGEASWADSSPTMTIRDIDGAEVASGTMNRCIATGVYFFRYIPKAVGVFFALWSFRVGGVLIGSSRTFKVVADPGNTEGGSDGSGAIIALHTYERPGVVHVIYETEDGDLVAKQDPS
jgi:hypothetical protein